MHHLGVGLDAADIFADAGEVRGRSRVGFGDHHDVGHAQHRFTGMVTGLVAGAQRVDQNDVQIWPDEREIIVTAVPQDHVGLSLGKAHDRRVVDAGVDGVAYGQVQFVFLAFLDRAFRRIKVSAVGEALHRLSLQVTVWHRVTNHRNLEAMCLQSTRQPACSL